MKTSLQTILVTIIILFSQSVSNSQETNDDHEYYAPTAEEIVEMENVIGANLRVHYKDRDIEVEIIDKPNRPLPQMWEKNKKGESELFVYWKYHIWHRNIHKHCQDLERITEKTRYCVHRQKKS